MIYNYVIPVRQVVVKCSSSARQVIVKPSPSLRQVFVKWTDASVSILHAELLGSRAKQVHFEMGG